MPERGELVMTPGGKGRSPRVQVRFQGNIFNPAQGQVSQSLLDRLQEFNGKDVEFEQIGGQPKQIREVGGSFVPPGTMSNAGQRGGGTRQGSRPERREVSGGQWRSGTQHQQPGAPLVRPDFHNPYNFIPAPPRAIDDPDLGDHRPMRQDWFDPDRYTGRIRVRMLAATPLLVPDPDNAREDNQHHKTFPLRLGIDGKPRIPASGVRGLLRSAYEAVTNSRFGRFSRAQHGDRLAFRMDARDGLKLIPARIEHGQIRLLTGTASVGQDSRPNGPMYAAWLPRYMNGQVGRNAVKYPDGSLPEHGDEVECWIECFQHSRWGSRNNRRVPDFQYWRPRKIVPAGQPFGAAPPPSQADPAQDGRSRHAPLGQPMQQVRGWLCITNANINRKHDERVFFVTTGASVPGPFPLTDVERAKWRELIDNYHAIHEDDLRKRREHGRRPDEYLGRDPGQTAWSRHVYTDGANKLEDGTLCYVRLNENKTAVDALSPVTISRELYPTSPWDLLDPSLRPAATINQLSPADRVFGWVRMGAGPPAGQQAGNEPVAIRGLLRVGPVTCASSVAEAIETFPGSGVPLAILSTPKPQQGRFYVATSPDGEAQADGRSKAQAGYAFGKGLRGRKVYPHHRGLPSDYWNNLDGGPYSERPGESCPPPGIPTAAKERRGAAGRSEPVYPRLGQARGPVYLRPTRS